MKIKNRGFLRKIDGLVKSITGMRKYSEILFMLVFCAYFYTSVTVISSVTFPLVKFFEVLFPFVIPVITVTQLITHIEYKKELVIGVVLAAAFWIISSYNGYESLKYLGFFAAGSIGTDCKKLLRYVCVIGFSVAFITFLYTFALDPSLNTVYVGKRIRSTAGMTYPTDAASLVLYMGLMLFAAGEGLHLFVPLIAGLISLVLSLNYYNSNTSAICSGLFLLLIGYGVASEVLGKKTGKKWMDRLVQVFAVISIPLLAAFGFVMSTLYGNGVPFAIKLNSFLHNRLKYTYEGITTMGVTLIGQKVEIVGASAPGIGKSEAYNFLDNSYIQIAVCHGMIAALIILAIWLLIIFRAIKGWNRRIVLIALVIAVHSFEEHHFFDIVNNPLLYLPLAVGISEESRLSELKMPSPKVLKRLAVGAAALVLAVLLSPTVFSFTRTAAYKAGMEDRADVTKRIEADRDAIEIILSSHKKPVYADVLTTAYTGEFKGIRKSAYSGEDLVRKLDCTVITDPAYSVAYFSRGCLYARISEYTSIYTRDMKVADALIDAGYHVAGFYYEETELDFNERYTTKSVPAFGSKGNIKGEITLLGEPVGSDEVCLLEVNSPSGAAETFKFKVKDFDENNSLKYNGEFKTGFGDVSFSIKALNGARLQVGNAILSSDTIIDDQNVELSFNNYYSDDFTLYSGKYRLDLKARVSDISEETTSLGTLIISMKNGKDITKDLAITEASEDGTYDFDFSFSSEGTIAAFSIKPDSSVKLEDITGQYVLRPRYDRHYTYDSKGRTTRVEYYDRDGNRTVTKRGVFAFEYEYDKKGNRTVTRYYDTNNDLMLSSGGYAEIHIEYDGLNHVVGTSYYGTNGEPVALKKGYSSFSQEVDSWGNSLVIKYFGIDGNQVITSMGYATIRMEYDDNNNVIYERYYDEHGDRCSVKQGYSGCRFEYDDAGNTTLIEYLDDNDKPVLIKKGYAQVHKEYDDNGKVTVLYYTDTQGNMVTLDKEASDSKYTSVTREYDDFGNNTVTRYFGRDTSEGYEEVRREFDSKKRVIYEGRFNSDGEAVILEDDYCAYSLEYDEDGNILSRTYYGTDGEPMLHEGKYATVRYEYDGLNRVVSESYYGVDEEAVLMASGFHTKTYDYGSDGNQSVIRYYGLEDEPVILKTFRCFEVRKTYDDSGNVIREEYYGIDGEPVMFREKFFAREMDYNEKGKVTAERRYDTEGNLIEK